jgi:hypothetical protein
MGDADGFSVPVGKESGKAIGGENSANDARSA